MKVLSVLAICLTAALAENIKIGDLSSLQHGVSGEVYAAEDNTIVLENFKYDGAGPDAFFWVGTDGSPKSNNEDKTHILDPSGVVFAYRDNSAPKLGRYDGEKITLKMPANMKVGDFKWISVWCRRFSIDFGNLIFPTNIELPKSEDSIPHPLAPVDSNEVAEPEPESESEPEPEGDHDHHDHHDHDHHDHDHNDVEPEPQGSGVRSLVSAGQCLAVLLVASLLL